MIEVFGKKLYDVKETAKMFGLNYKSLYRMVSGGRIKAKKVGQRYYISEETIREFIE